MHGDIKAQICLSWVIHGHHGHHGQSGNNKLLICHPCGILGHRFAVIAVRRFRSSRLLTHHLALVARTDATGQRMAAARSRYANQARFSVTGSRSSRSEGATKRDSQSQDCGHRGKKIEVITASDTHIWLVVPCSRARADATGQCMATSRPRYASLG